MTKSRYDGALIRAETHLREALAEVQLERELRSDREHINHHDLCYLSRVFNAASQLRDEQDRRINEWLKNKIACSVPTKEAVPEPDEQHF